MSTYEAILEYTSSLEIIDTHEHLISTEQKYLEGSWRATETPGRLDVLKDYLLHYFCWDLVSAGLPLSSLDQVRKTDIPLLEKWDLIEEHWEYSSYTGYGRALDIAAQGIYGLSRISRDTIQELNHAFLDSLREGKYKTVLKDLSKITVALNQPIDIEENMELECDPEFFKPVFGTLQLVRPESAEDIFKVEKRTGIRITSFDAFLKCCESSIDWALTKGAVALKSHIAYQRPLLFERTTRALAEAEFNRFLNSINRDQTGEYKTELIGENAQNYLMHYILRLANERGLVYQIHTGLQEGAGNYIDWSDPGLLNNLFIQYPDVRFVLFHMAYPFQGKLSALAKNFPNVFIDMCWAHIVSPEASIQAIVEWLDALPYNKICGFGGDYTIVDAVYGHQALARENISRALAIKVEQGRFDLEKANEIAKGLLVDNPRRIYRLEGE